MHAVYDDLDQKMKSAQTQELGQHIIQEGRNDVWEDRTRWLQPQEVDLSQQGCMLPLPQYKYGARAHDICIHVLMYIMRCHELSMSVGSFNSGASSRCHVRARSPSNTTGSAIDPAFPKKIQHESRREYNRIIALSMDTL